MKITNFLHFWGGISCSDTPCPHRAEVLSVLNFGAPSFKKILDLPRLLTTWWNWLSRIENQQIQIYQNQPKQYIHPFHTATHCLIIFLLSLAMFDANKNSSYNQIIPDNTFKSSININQSSKSSWLKNQHTLIYHIQPKQRISLSQHFWTLSCYLSLIRLDLNETITILTK